MHQVRQADDGKWQILDESDQTVFVGTRPQCQDWLDRQDNLHEHLSIVRRIAVWLRRRFGAGRK